MTETPDAPHDSELAGIVRSFPAARVVVLGDVMLDRYVNGQASRLSPEAPIPVLRPRSTHATLGGAANVALNVATLGGTAWLCGVTGDDAAGAELAGLLRGQGRIHADLVTVAGRPTTAKTRFMVGPHQLMRLDEETTQPIGQAEAAALLDRFRAALAHADIVVLSDYAKGVLCDDVLGMALALAKAAGLRVIADPKREDFTAYRGADVLTPNELEVRAATGIEAAEDDGAEQAGRAALGATKGAAVLVSPLGARPDAGAARLCGAARAHARPRRGRCVGRGRYADRRPGGRAGRRGRRCRRLRRWRTSPPACRWPSRAPPPSRRRSC